MAVLSQLMDEDEFHALSDAQVRGLEARLSKALISSPEVHKVLAAEIQPKDVLRRG